MTVWLVANGVALVLLGVVLAAWARVQPRVRPYALAAALAVILVAVGLFVLSSRAQVPTGWITVLMEGRSIRNVLQLYGLGTRAGDGFYHLVDWLSGHDVTTLRAVVHLNLCLAAINTTAFFFIATYVLRSWWASLLFALAYAFNLHTVHAAFSETPAMAWTTYFWLGCIAAAVVDDDASNPLWLRRLALLWLALLVWLAAQLRAELLVLGVPAVAVGMAKTLGWESRLRDMVRRTLQLVSSIVTARLSVFLFVSLALASLELWPLGTDIVGWAVAGLRPLNFSFLNMPWMLGISLPLPGTPCVFLPFGLIVLFVLGMVYGLRRWVPFCLLPISVVILLKVYAAASHGVFFERLRYLTFVAPVALFLALFGFRELCDWAQRWAWPSWWKRVSVLLLVVSCTVWQAPGPGEIFRRAQQLPGLTRAHFLLGWNQQTEVRYLLDLVDRYPSCVFLAKTVESTWAGDERRGYLWTAFGRSLPRYREAPAVGGSLERVAAELAAEAPCVLFYRSLDCDLVGTDGCRAETEGRVALEEQVLENLPYSDIREYGAHRPEIHLGVYRVRPST